MFFLYVAMYLIALVVVRWALFVDGCSLVVF